MAARGALAVQHSGDRRRGGGASLLGSRTQWRRPTRFPRARVLRSVGRPSGVRCARTRRWTLAAWVHGVARGAGGRWAAWSTALRVMRYARPLGSAKSAGARFGQRFVGRSVGRSQHSYPRAGPIAHRRWRARAPSPSAGARRDRWHAFGTRRASCNSFVLLSLRAPRGCRWVSWGPSFSPLPAAG